MNVKNVLITISHTLLNELEFKCIMLFIAFWVVGNILNYELTTNLNFFHSMNAKITADQFSLVSLLCFKGCC